MKKIHYFGTELRTCGHFFWELEGEGIGRSKLDFKDLPFDPEDLPLGLQYHYPRKGSVHFYRIGGYTICRIEGSCIDTRPGTKSVFFVEGVGISYVELYEQILATPYAKRIIDAMPFKVQDPRTKEYIQILKDRRSHAA